MSSTSSYECAICLHRYQSPTLIPTCGHTFCASCVASLPTDRLRSTASCPLCRNRFDVRACVPNYALAAALESEAHGEPASPRPSAPPLETMQFTTHAPNVPRASQSSAVQRLRSLGFPAGLARLVTDADSRVGLRLFILDNSGSTGEMDGNKLTAEYGTLKMKACSRWDEIKAMAVLQARVAVAVGVPAEFHLLNPLGGNRSSSLSEGDGFVRVHDEESFSRFNSMLAASSPRGVTPLADSLRGIRRRLDAETERLRGKQVFLTIATDGLPTSATSGHSDVRARDDMVSELRALSVHFGVQLVIRLCTDDNDVVDFFGKLDAETELSMDVLDDFKSEAQEVRRCGNGWLTYAPAVHTVREGGTCIKLLDLLDERALNVHETAALVELLFGVDASTGVDIPLALDYTSDLGAYCDEVKRRADLLGTYYNPLSGRCEPLVNVGALRKALTPRGVLGKAFGYLFGM